MRITILGAGAFGSALEKILSEKNHEVTFYDPIKFPATNIADAINPSEIIICAAPSTVVPDLLTQIPDKTKPLINASKGFLSLAPFKDFPNFSLLSGGAFATSLEQHKPAILTATSDLARDLFQTDWLKVEKSSDIFGVLLCSTFKNIYAIGSGTKNLKPNTPDFRAYIEDTLSEIKYLLTANECNPATADLSCGKLDLIITCASKESRNYQFGQALTKHNHLDQDQITATTEGFSAIKNLPNSTIIIPENCDILNQIIERVQNATQ